MPTIGQRIKQLRFENNLTQEDFGKLFGIVKSTVSMYENDKSIPDDEIKKKIAEKFQITLDWLMGVSDIRNPANTSIPEPWWDKGDPLTCIELEEFVKNQSNIKLMGDPLDEDARNDVIMFLRAAHELIKQKRKPEESGEGENGSGS